MISIDGFRHDYVEKYKPKHIINRIIGNNNQIKRSGVRSKRMKPIFPSKTFPNHVTLVTGLYAEQHNIIANEFFDPDSNIVFDISKKISLDPRWWQNMEPLWVSAEKQNMTSAAYFWPGSNVPIHDTLPTYFQEKYNADVPYSKRINTILSYLDLTHKRPQLILTYMSGVDSAGHLFGPDSDHVGSEVTRMDDAIGLLLDGLEKRNISEHVNVVLVSDHGMTSVASERVLYLNDVYPQIETSCDIHITGVLTDLRPKNVNDTESIYRSIKSARDANLNYANAFDIFLKQDIPDPYHFKDSRLIPPILVVAKLGWEVTTRSRGSPITYFNGDHGFDNIEMDMGAFFAANGPAFRNDGSTQEEFDNIHVYSMLSKVLGLQEAPNSGDWKQVQFLLRQT
jgi:predicted AlkP superfamily pyrophosphatase or phosphodiesterase